MHTCKQPSHLTTNIYIDGLRITFMCITQHEVAGRLIFYDELGLYDLDINPQGACIDRLILEPRTAAPDFPDQSLALPPQ